jgi:hypothetical protein
MEATADLVNRQLAELASNEPTYFALGQAFVVSRCRGPKHAHWSTLYTKTHPWKLSMLLSNIVLAPKPTS